MGDEEFVERKRRLGWGAEHFEESTWAGLVPPWGMMIASVRGGNTLSKTVTYLVPGITAVTARVVENELLELEEVDTAEADVESKIVTVSGRGLKDERLRQAIEDAGYEGA